MDLHRLGVALGRLAFATTAALALTACERTVFESPPAAAAAACDTALVGRWLSEGDAPGDRGELEAIIDAECRLQTIEHKQDGPRHSTPTALNLAKVDGQHYLWFDAAWAHAQFEVESNLLDRPGDIYLYAYRLKGTKLSLAAPPHRALATRIIERDIRGDVLLQDDSVTVRVEGDSDAIRAMLRKRKPFRFGDDALRFTRAPAGAP
jgi:hypothetical protein